MGTLDAAGLGALGFMGFCHTSLFLLRRREKPSLYFGLVCLAFSMRIISASQAISTRVFPGLSPELSITLRYISSSALLPLGAAYVENSFPDDVRFPVARFATAGWIAFLSFVLTLGPEPSSPVALFCGAFDLVICVFTLLVLIRAMKHRRFGSHAVALGSLAFLSYPLLDLPHFAGFLPWGRFFQPAIVILCFTQSCILSWRLARELESCERLSKELSLANKELLDLSHHLEERADLRTWELLESNRKLEAINSEIARMDEARRHLLANIAHDVRTPVTLIRGYAEAILDGVIEGEENWKKYIELIQSKVGSLTILIEDLFELTQLEARRTTLDAETVDVFDIIEKIYKKHEPDIKEAGMLPRLVLPDISGGKAPACVSVDPDRIDRVMSNLYFNAIKFSQRGGEIVTGCSIGPKEATITVQDKGPGIPEEDLPFIFDRFYKSPRSRASTSGSGLGLSIAKEIVELHGGRIWVESTVGEGTTFYFTLPLVLSSEPEEN
ncbi:MAG: hypothetical protein GX863_02475 [Firmicutes bacterium]|jgi:signal transduction histidine kinase|nr:hypothetical protein [Candidatus Fermentithermobacillaceae bacterium]